MEWVVGINEAGYKLLDFISLRLGPSLSKRIIKKSIESGHCFINQRSERFASYSLRMNDLVVFTLVEATHLKLDLTRILFEDEWLLGYNKPPGIASDDPEFLKAIGVMLLHRLDKETSGVLLFAKTKAVKTAIESQFREKQIHKTYLALVQGVPYKKQGLVENFLGKIHQQKGQVIWGIVGAEKGLWSQTHWTKLKTSQEFSLLQCEPVTGRTHQIRIHLSSIDLPILGDHVYGRSKKFIYPATRCMLHAQAIQFTHPILKTNVTITAEIPADFKNAMDEILP